MDPRLPDRPDEVDAGWLTAVLRRSGALSGGAVVAARGEQIGTGQVGANYRYHLRYDGGTGPATIVVKVASRDPESRAAGIATLTYEREVGFYTTLAGTVDVRRPRCHFAAVEPGTADVVIVLDDLAPARQGDQIAGCDLATTRAAVTEAARLHGPRWGDRSLDAVPWLSRRSGPRADELVEAYPALWAGFADRYGDRLGDEARHVGLRLVDGLGPWLAGAGDLPATLTHGDFRLDNLMIDVGADGSVTVTVVDWQTCGHGSGPADVAYFVGAGLLPAARRRHETELVEAYVEALAAYPGVDVDPARVWSGYRRHAFGGFLMAVAASMIVGRTDRGDDMFMAMANRHAVQAVELDSEEFLRA